MTRATVAPPRPISPGDIVVGYSPALGEWTAAQVTDLDSSWGGGTAGVLDLDWSGPEPASVDDLGALVPLRLTHHAHSGRLSHCNFEWLLPRSCRVIGNVALLHDRRANSYSSGWRIGTQLALQRRWDRGERSTERPGIRSFSGAEIAGLTAGGATFPELWDVTIDQIETLDCNELVALFPNGVRLRVSGPLGSLTNARELNRLAKLRTLFIHDLFGMTRDDRLLPSRVPDLEMLGLYSTPAEYSAAMKKLWTPEIPNGTFVEIRSPRKPEWLAENRDNPLRDWEGREHISSVRYRKSLAQYKATRQAVLETLKKAPAEGEAATLIELGRQYGTAFNQLDGTRSPFIETEEREELFAALNHMVGDAEAIAGRPFDMAREHLSSGVESVRTW